MPIHDQIMVIIVQHCKYTDMYSKNDTALGTCYIFKMSDVVSISILLLYLLIPFIISNHLILNFIGIS